MNWYRFTAIDIPVGEMSVLLLGLNGAGKSSLIDGIQTVIVGGDERALPYNAIGNGASSGDGRSLKSYALGVIKDIDSVGMYEARTTSNSYLALTFTDDNGKCFSACVSLYAHKNHSETEKNQFLLHGASISKDDFMDTGGRVLPWADIKARLQDSEGRLELFNNSTMKKYRQQFAEMISAPGYVINAEQLMRTLKAGLNFKTDLKISDFIRKYILPEKPLDIGKLRNIRAKHVEMVETLNHGKEKLKEVESITELFEKRERKLSSISINQWIEFEAQRLYLCELADKIADEYDGLCEESEVLTGEIETLTKARPALEERLSVAKVAFDSNDQTAVIESKQTEINGIQHDINSGTSLINVFRRNLLDLTKPLESNVIIDNQHFIDWSIAASKLREVISGNGVLDAWPDNERHAANIANHTQLLFDESGKVGESLYQEREALKNLTEECELLRESVKKLAAGGSSLSNETTLLQKLLDDKGIKSTPICDVVEVTDKKWQSAIESFLGMNREALIVDEQDAEEAVSIYRREVRNHRLLRKCKIINPNKIIHQSREVMKGSAYELLSIDDSVGETFLKGFLSNLILVDTERELLDHKRAITPDGIIASNGAIGGVRIQDILLFGREARIQSSRTQSKRLDEKELELSKCKIIAFQLNELNQKIDGHKATTFNYSKDIVSVMKSIADGVLRVNKIQKEIDAFHTAEFRHLSKTLEDAKTAVNENATKKEKLNFEYGGVMAQQEIANQELEKANRHIDEFTSSTQEWENDSSFDLDIASQELSKREELFGGVLEIKQDAYKKISDIQKRIGNIDIVITELRTRFLNKHSPNDNALPDKDFAEQYDYFIDVAKTLNELELPLRHKEALNLKNDMLGTFRTEVMLKLRELLEGMKIDLKELDKQLKGRVFHKQYYSFQRFRIEDPNLNALRKFVEETTDEENMNANSLFDDHSNHEAVEVIDQLLESDDFMELIDYRNYYSYDIKLTDVNDGSTQLVSKRRGTLSGGELQVPQYICLGAAFGQAFKLRLHTNDEGNISVFGGAAFAVFDECFNNLDGKNASAVMGFFKEMGLQVIIAGPPESEVKVAAHSDLVLNMVRHGPSVTIDYRKMKKKAFKIMESDDPETNKEILDVYIKEVKLDREEGRLN